MLDAYTVRKAAPRILIAVIGINLSIYLCVAAVDITAIISRGLQDMLVAPFVGDGGIVVDNANTFDGNPVTSGVLTVIALVILKSAVTGPGVGAILGSLLPLLLIVGLIALAVLFTLVVRQALIIFLCVVSPVAIACFVLPGTEKYFQKWFDLFIKTLLVYPIIAILFAMSNVMAAILLNDAATSYINPVSNTASLFQGGAQLVAQAAGEQDDFNQTVKLLAAIVIIYAPLVLIPFAFKLAGGAISAVMNAAQGATQRRRASLADGRSKGLAQSKAENMEKFKAGQRFEGKRWIPGSQSIARRINRTGLAYGTGLRGHYGVGSHGASARQNAIEQAAAAVSQTAEFKKIANIDGALRAGTYASESDALQGLAQHYVDLGETDERAAMLARHDVSQFKTSGLKYGSQATQQAAARQMVVTGTSYNDIGDMTRVLARVSGGNADSAASLAGFANATTKQVGRWDLAPGFGGLNDLVQAQAGTGQQSAAFRTRYGDGAPVQESFDSATIRATRESTDAGTLARTSKPQVFANLNAASTRASDRATGAEDRISEAQARFHAAEARGNEVEMENERTTIAMERAMIADRENSTQLIVEAESNRYSTPGGVTDHVDQWGGSEAGQPRIYRPGYDPRDPRLRQPDDGPGGPAAPPPPGG